MVGKSAFFMWETTGLTLWIDYGKIPEITIPRNMIKIYSKADKITQAVIHSFFITYIVNWQASIFTSLNDTFNILQSVINTVSPSFVIEMVSA